MKRIIVKTTVPATVSETWVITVPDDYDTSNLGYEHEMTRLINKHYFKTHIDEVDADSDDLTVWHSEEVV
jgi:hypothetical protein